MAEDPEVAFRRAFDTHARMILGYALRRTDDAADAADVVAETFLVAWRRSHELLPDDEVRPWLVGVARRVLANQRRGNLRRNALADRLRTRLTEQVVADPAERVERAHVVHEALQRLREDDREVLLLTVWEGLTPVEIATALGIPAATVRTRLHRARKRLRPLLDGAHLTDRIEADQAAGTDRTKADRADGVGRTGADRTDEVDQAGSANGVGPAGHVQDDGTPLVRDVESTS